MGVRGVVLAVGCGGMLFSTAVAAEIQLGPVLSGCSTVKLFERCELTVALNGPIRNPYDPEEVRLEAVFRPPKGSPVTIDGFYYQPFERSMDEGRDVIRAAGDPVWKIRFTPRQPGRWASEVRLTTSAGTQSLPAQPFLVAASSRQGFVRLDREEGRFQFETGQPFIPIGENLGWGPSAYPLRSYDHWMSELESQRANYIRVWMAPWFLSLETKETGVGHYDQLRAWQLDYLMDRSESAGLFWQLCLLSHGSFSRSQDPDWHNNPYNEALGGMCRLPNDFLTDPRAKTMFRRLLRYLASRWGYSPQLAVWELFNEAEYGEFRMEDLTVWIREMSRFLREIDVNTRPITTSFHRESPEEVWRLPTIDTIQLHVYDQRDFAETFGGPAIAKLKQTFGKPVLVGEFGWIGETMRKADDIGIHVHDGLWSSLIGGAHGSALAWYWDTYIHPNQLERHLRPLALFWRGEQLGRRMKRVEVSLTDPHLAGWGIGSRERAHLWIKNRAHTVDQYLAYRSELAKRRLAEARGESATPFAYAPTPVQGAKVTIRGVRWSGRYRVEWWDTYRGRITKRSTIEARRGTLTVDVPEVNVDIAAKLIRLQWWERG